MQNYSDQLANFLRLQHLRVTVCFGTHVKLLAQRAASRGAGHSMISFRGIARRMIGMAGRSFGGGRC